MKKRFACMAVVIVPFVLAQEIVPPPRSVLPPSPPVSPPPPPPVVPMPGSPILPRAAPEVPPVQKPKEKYFVITVEEGETLEDIARSYIVPVSELAKVNGLKPGARIRAGDKLKIPPSVY